MHFLRITVTNSIQISKCFVMGISSFKKPVYSRGTICRALIIYRIDIFMSLQIPTTKQKRTFRKPKTFESHVLRSKSKCRIALFDGYLFVRMAVDTRATHKRRRAACPLRPARPFSDSWENPLVLKLEVSSCFSINLYCHQP